MEWQNNVWLDRSEIIAFTDFAGDIIDKILRVCRGVYKHPLVLSRLAYEEKQWYQRRRKYIFHLFKLLAAGKKWLNQTADNEKYGDPNYRLPMAKIINICNEIYRGMFRAAAASEKRELAEQIGKKGKGAGVIGYHKIHRKPPIHFRIITRRRYWRFFAKLDRIVLSTGFGIVPKKTA